MIENTKMSDQPWETSKLFFRADVPGQKELRTVLRWLVEAHGFDMKVAQILTWAWLVEVHGSDDQGEAK